MSNDQRFSKQKYYMRAKRSLHPRINPYELISERPSTSSSKLAPVPDSQVCTSTGLESSHDSYDSESSTSCNLPSSNDIVNSTTHLTFQNHSHSSQSCNISGKITSENDLSFSFELAQWSLRNNISHVALKQLLNTQNCYTTYNLPSDPRTLLKTPRNIVLKSVTPRFSIRFC